MRIHRRSTLRIRQAINSANMVTTESPLRLIKGVSYTDNLFDKYIAQTAHLKIIYDSGQFQIGIIHEANNAFIYLQTYQLFPADQDPNPIPFLQQIFSMNQKLQSHFATKTLAFGSLPTTLVPSAFFTERSAADYLSLVNQFESAVAIYEKISEADAYQIGALPESWMQSLHEWNAGFRILPAEAYFFSYLLKNNSGDTVHLYVHPRQIDIFYLHEKELQFANQFKFHSAEDAVYYVMLIYKQLQLNAEEIPLVIYGEIEPTSAIAETLFKYVRHVQFASRNTERNYSDALVSPSHYYFNLFTL